ncbi:MAG: 2Fe-2S iron-sulfur cluster-binding protein [Promethearchaeia archaeon]
MNEENQKNILIDFEPISRRVKLRTFNKTLYDILTKIDVNIRAECGGAGKCGKCQLKIQKGGKFLNRPTDSEKKLLTKGQLEKGIRLACQTKIEGKNKDEIAKKEPPQIKIYLPEELLIEDFTILTTGSGLGVELNVAIEKIFLNVEESSLERPIPDLERTILLN